MALEPYSNIGAAAFVVVVVVALAVCAAIWAFICGDSCAKHQRIVCPGCKKKQWATVRWPEDDPFPTYMHECRCGYIVIESEWQPCGLWYKLRKALRGGGEK